MNAMIVLLGGLIALIVGYVCYGGWLAKQWGVDPKRPAPAQELEDGVEYVPSKPYVLLCIIRSSFFFNRWRWPY